MRRLAIPLLLLALLAAALFVALRGTDDGATPVVDRPRDASSETPRAPRVRAPEPAPLPPRAIRVAVTSLDGRPVAGARLELFRGPAGEMKDEQFHPGADAPRGEYQAVAGSDGAGVFGEVRPARWFVVADAPGFARHVVVGTTRDVDESVLDTAVALEKGSPFAGTIRDPDGAPAAGVVVVLQPIGPWPSDVTCIRTTTDANGAYRFDAVEAGRYVLWHTVRPGFFVEAARVMLPSLDGLDIRIVRGAAIDGVVRDAESGVPVPGARVFGIRTVESRSSADPGSTTVFDVATTDHLGRFALHTWRRQFEVTRLAVDAPGHAPMPVDDNGRGPPGGVSEGQRFVFDLRVRRAATLKGTLSTAEGPLAGFVVRARPKDQNEDGVPQSDMWSCVTGADGSFLVDRLPAGLARIWILDKGSGWNSTETREAQLAPGDVTVRDVRLDVRRVPVTRRVVNSKDEPVASVTVVQRFGPLRAEARTDAEGRFRMDAIAVDRDVSWVEVSAGRVRQLALISVADEGDHGLFPPIPETTVTGTLVRDDGTPVAGERLDLRSGFEGNHGFITLWSALGESVSAADGTFRIPLPSGPDFSVTVRRVGFPDSEQGEDGSLRIVVSDAVHVAGLAVSPDGTPVRGALARLDDGVVVARSGPDGRLAFSWTPPFDAPRELTCDGLLPAPFANGTRMTLLPALAVAGHVRTIDGAPVSGLLLEVRQRAESTETSATDADGRFVVPGLATGPCLVTVSDPVRFAFATQDRTVTAADESVAFVVRPGARLEVEVVDAAGERIPGARVAAHPSSAELADLESFTRRSERVVLGLVKDAPYTLRVDHDRFEPAERSDVRGGGDPVRIVLKKKP